MNKQKLIELRCKAWGITEDEYYCNQCSDFSLEDMARAYRRGKNKGARDKAIQNVGFYQKQMQDIYDKKNKQIAELSKHIVELQNDKGELIDRCRELEAQIEQLQKINNEQKETLKKVRVALIQERTANIMNYGKGGVEMFDSMFEILKGVSN